MLKGDPILHNIHIIRQPVIAISKYNMESEIGCKNLNSTYLVMPATELNMPYGIILISAHKKVN